MHVKDCCIQLASLTFACYNHAYIKRGLTRPANLQLVQGGYLGRGMWPNGNIERQPFTDKPLEGFIMSNSKDIHGTQRPKPVFAKLTPQMTSEEQVQNLIAVLKKSGFTIKPSVKKSVPSQDF
jgi:hypothetical protein|tara:strand:+ start:284 stop:652 length:369 start_codon:yes stop_codon:yes gene_type:complete